MRDETAMRLHSNASIPANVAFSIVGETLTSEKAVDD